MSDFLDRQGFRVRVGVAYLFVFAQPGNDTTAIVIESLNDDGTVSGYDVNFKFSVENLRTEKLWRPLKHSWNRFGEKGSIIEYAGESALSLE